VKKVKNVLIFILPTLIAGIIITVIQNVFKIYNEGYNALCALIGMLTMFYSFYLYDKYK